MRETAMLRSLRWILSLAVVCVLAPQAGFSQQVTAAIGGQVTDPTGAVIVRATVVATELDRGTKWKTETNVEGVYNLPRVPTGNYEIRVESKGFQTAVRPAFTLELNQMARLDFQLKLGQVTRPWR